jgi:hypothetical protein
VVLHCEECAGISLNGRGWIALIIDDEEDPETPACVASWCAACAEREFGLVSPRAHES